MAKTQGNNQSKVSYLFLSMFINELISDNQFPFLSSLQILSYKINKQTTFRTFRISQVMSSRRPQQKRKSTNSSRLPKRQQQAPKASQEDDQQITQNEILQMLHRKKMPSIEQRFQQREKGLPIDDFVSCMLEHLDYDKKNKKLKHKITLAWIDFFKQVDVSGDQTMEWQEFSNHIIELGLLRNDRSFKNVIKTYFPSERILDRQKHQTGVEGLFYFEKLKNIFMIQKQSSRFKVYNVNNANLLYEVNAHKGTILDLEYLQNQNLLATSSNDLTINFWDASSFTLKQIVSVPQIQLKIKYANWKSANKQFLYTGGSDAIIHIYDALTLKQKGTISGWNPFYKNDSQQQGHSSPIGDILPIDSQQTLVSACLGGNICLWDSVNHQLKKQLRGHDKGVYSLDWCSWSQMNQCLLSAGLDHQAFVWNTYVKDKIFLLRGHNHPLIGVKCLPETPQVVTADITGMVKVWDVRNFLCVQTFNAPVEELSSFCLTYSTIPSQPMKKRIICGGKKMHYFEYDQPKDQLLTDEKPCIHVIFNMTLLCFITLHTDCLKVWDAKSGKLSSVYRGLTTPGYQLTCMILDSRQRKLFVGDSQGAIFTVNIKNGAKMKSFQKHDSPVTGLGYWCSDSSNISDQRYSDLRRIISISMNSEVFIHDEDAPEDAKSSCRYIMKQHKDGCNSISVRVGHQILATGSEDGSTIITNLISYRHEVLPHCMENTPSQNEEIKGIKHVLFLDPFEALISIDIHGLITFYGVGESKFKNKVLFTKQYETESMTNEIEAFPVSCVKFERESQILIIGDEFGNIECWQMGQFIQSLVFTKVQKSVLSKRREGQSTKSKMSIREENTSFLITDISRKKEQTFSEDLITRHLKVKQAHTDGITCIQLVKENNAFITSSFDCCCYVWRIEDGTKIGALLLGGDPKWGLRFNLEAKKEESIKEADELLERLDKKKMLFYSQGLSKQEDIKEYEVMKSTVLKGARDILDLQKKIYGNQQPLIDILGDTNKLQKEFFEQQEEQDSSLNLMNQLMMSAQKGFFNGAGKRF